MFNNHNFEFNNTFECVLKRGDTVLATFNAREYETEQQNAGFVGGGIYSGGQSYAVATTYDFGDIVFKSGLQNLLVDGKLYKVTRVGRTHDILTKPKFRKKRIETVFYLE